MLTVYLRESDDGALHGAQRLGLAVLTPFQVAGERIARPFQDAYGYVSDLTDAKAEKDALAAQVQALRDQVILYQTAAQDNQTLRETLAFIDGPRFPQDFTPVTTRVIAQPASAYDQQILVAAGSSDGVAEDDPVVTSDGLVGKVTKVSSNASQVTLLTDQSMAVSAIDLTTAARGVAKPASSSDGGLVLDRVDKAERVEVDDMVVTSGWREGDLSSLYPRGIVVGRVTEVGQQDIDLFKRIQIAPAVDFDSLSEVVILTKQGMTLDVVKAAVLIAVASVAQVSIVNSFELVEGRADLVLLCVVGIALLRGPIFGACAGFFAGLIVDVGTLGTLGLTSLLLTLGGYWAGRLGEATSNQRNQVARILIAVTLLTIGVGIGSMIVHLLLGESVAVGTIVVQAILPSLLLNLILAIPVYLFCRVLFRPPAPREREIPVG